ncbi:MAG: S26 family signal peptidase [Ignavibacteria bacterium]|nr:S26 family signal peptidase [Ignavibacteria bacterium]
MLIPKSGKIIILDSNNYMLYKIPIEYETNASLKLVNNRLFLDEELIEHYRFKNNYYFVVGDNIMHSSDSRYFGFVPEEFIVGVVWRIKNNIHQVF